MDDARSVITSIRAIFGQDIPAGMTRKDMVKERQARVDARIGNFDRAIYRELLNGEIRAAFYRLVDDVQARTDANLLRSVPFGTKQWSDESCNIRKADSLCSNSCVYCYVLPIVNKNFKQVKISNFMKNSLVLKTFIGDRSERDRNMPCIEIDWNKVMKRWTRSNSKLVMTPTSHDVVPGIVDAFIASCLNLLDAGHSLLITTKPRMHCIERMCDAFSSYKDGVHERRVTFRFTLTTHDQDVKDKWEWLAPTFDDGIECLDLANQHGFQTSVSMEPFLKDPVETVNRLNDHVTGEIWIGMMNGFPSEKVLGMTLPAFVKDEITRLKTVEYTFDNIERVVHVLRDDARVHWKESIINMFLDHRNY